MCQKLFVTCQVLVVEVLNEGALTPLEDGMIKCMWDVI